MKFNSIAEFVSTIPKCLFCNSEPGVILCSGKSPKFRPNYNMGYFDTTFGAPYVESNDIKYKSVLVYKEFLAFYYILNEKEYTILSIDINTGKINGDIDRLQKVFWDHELSIVSGCSNTECKMQGYLCQTTPLFLERKKSRICPFWIDTEAMNVIFDDKRYSLSSSRGSDQTSLYGQGYSLVKVLPRMDLRAMTDKDKVINKIKTILVFS